MVVEEEVNNSDHHEGGREEERWDSSHVLNASDGSKKGRVGDLQREKVQRRSPRFPPSLTYLLRPPRLRVKHDEERSGSHGVRHEADGLGLGCPEHEVQHGREVLLAVLIPGKLPVVPGKARGLATVLPIGRRSTKEQMVKLSTIKVLHCGANALRWSASSA